MKQLNINITPQFERDLQRYMKQKNLTRKCDAVRDALRQAVEHGAGAGEQDYRTWLGLGLRAPLRRKPRFRTEDDLWS